MTQHHALRGNMADVSAKDSAQETAVNLVASFSALLTISTFGNSIFLFILMLILHVVFNYFAVRAVCLRSLNEPRFLQVIDTYLRREVIATPCEVNRNEPIIFYQLGSNMLDLKICGFQIKLGQSITQITTQCSNALHLKTIKEIYISKSYILYPDTTTRIMYVHIKEYSSSDDILGAYFHAVLLAITTCAINDHHLPLFQTASDPKPFAQVCKTLQSAEWSRVTGTGSGFNYDPSYELLQYVCNIATTEWHIVRDGLVQTGWDISKHLLMVDEWRICNDNMAMAPETIPPVNFQYPHLTLVPSSATIPPGNFQCPHSTLVPSQLGPVQAFSDTLYKNEFYEANDNEVYEANDNEVYEADDSEVYEADDNEVYEADASDTIEPEEAAKPKEKFTVSVAVGPDEPMDEED